MAELEPWQFVDRYQEKSRYDLVYRWPCGTVEHPHELGPNPSYCTACKSELAVRWKDGRPVSAVGKEWRDYVDRNRT